MLSRVRRMGLLKHEVFCFFFVPLGMYIAYCCLDRWRERERELCVWRREVDFGKY